MHCDGMLIEVPGVDFHVNIQPLPGRDLARDGDRLGDHLRLLFVGEGAALLQP